MKFKNNKNTIPVVLNDEYYQQRTEAIQAADTPTFLDQGLHYGYCDRFSEFNPAVSTTDYDPFLCKQYKSDFIQQLYFFLQDNLISINIFGNNDKQNQLPYFSVSIIFYTYNPIRNAIKDYPHLPFYDILCSFFYFCMDFHIFALGTDSLGTLRFGFNKYKYLKSQYPLGKIIFQPTPETGLDIDRIKSLATVRVIGNQPQPYHNYQVRNLLQYRYLFYPVVQTYNWGSLSLQHFDTVEIFYDIKKHPVTFNKLNTFLSNFNQFSSSVQSTGASYNEFDIPRIIDMETITSLPTSFYHDFGIFPLHISPVYTWLQYANPRRVDP